MVGVLYRFCVYFIYRVWLILPTYLSCSLHASTHTKECVRIIVIREIKVSISVFALLRLSPRIQTFHTHPTLTPTVFLPQVTHHPPTQQSDRPKPYRVMTCSIFATGYMNPIDQLRFVGRFRYVRPILSTCLARPIRAFIPVDGEHPIGRGD